MKASEIEKLVVPPIRRGDADKVKNSLAHLNGALDAAGLTEVAYMVTAGSSSDEKLLARIVQRWVGADDETMTQLSVESGLRRTAVRYER